MKFVALVSGGKDSLYSTQESIRNGHELVCCIHLGAPLEVEEESFMYQTAGSEVMPVLVEECLGVPLILHRRTGKSVKTSLVYDHNDQEGIEEKVEDEVEDLYVALKKAQEQFPEIQAVSSGAILSTYQRVRIEHVCSRLGLTSLSYLWRLAPQHELLQRMLEAGIEAVLVKTACPPGLIPSKHLNKTLGTLYYSGLFERLHERFQFHYCGEGGEYESLVVDCPLYKKRLVLDEVNIVETDDGVGELVITKCHAEDKDTSETQATELENDTSTPVASSSSATADTSPQACVVSKPAIRCLPNVQRLSGGLLHISEILSPMAAQPSESETSESELAVKEALAIFDTLKETMQRHGSNSRDVMLVHLYLSEISHFANINEHYRNVFGTLLPPSRSCVAIGPHVLPGGRRVMLDCLVQLGSGAYMRDENAGIEGNQYTVAAKETKSLVLRQVLHVQSLSYWAPVCVGPYSQVNTLRSGVHFIAGQIGLDPPTMKLKDGWSEQLKQCWTNVARILDALEGGSLTNLLSCLIYVSGEVTDWDLVHQITYDMIATNGNVVPGTIDSTGSLSEMYGGYEDEGTWLEMTRNDPKRTFKVPLLIVAIPEMPIGALIEVEPICITQKVASCLELKYSSSEATGSRPSMYEPEIGWSTGHDFDAQPNAIDTKDSIRINAATISFGSQCSAMCTVVASVANGGEGPVTQPDVLLSDMLDAAISSLKSSASLGIQQVLNVRLYHVASNSDGSMVNDDGLQWRASLATSLALKAVKTGASMPATSVIPVRGIKFVYDEHDVSAPFIALQVMAIDPVRMETELWIHNGRERNDSVFGK